MKKTPLESAANRLLDTRDLLSDFPIEGEMLIQLLGANPDDAVARGMSCVLNRWLTSLEDIEIRLEKIQNDLSAALEAAEPPAPELTPAEKLERSRWQAAQFRKVADEVEAEAVAEFAAAGDATPKESPAAPEQGRRDPQHPLTVDLSDHEAGMLARIAEREGCDLSRTASSLLGGAIRQHAAAVAGGAA